MTALLVKKNKNIDVVDDNKKTAPMLAMKRKFEKAVEFLINNDVKMNLNIKHKQNIFRLVEKKTKSRFFYNHTKN